MNIVPLVIDEAEVDTSRSRSTLPRLQRSLDTTTRQMLRNKEALRNEMTSSGQQHQRTTVSVPRTYMEEDREEEEEDEEDEEEVEDTWELPRIHTVIQGDAHKPPYNPRRQYNVRFKRLARDLRSLRTTIDDDKEGVEVTQALMVNIRSGRVVY